MAIDGSSTVDTKVKTYPRMIKIRRVATGYPRMDTIDGSSTVDTKVITYPRMIKIRQGGN